MMKTLSDILYMKELLNKFNRYKIRYKLFLDFHSIGISSSSSALLPEINAVPTPPPMFFSLNVGLLADPMTIPPEGANPAPLPIEADFTIDILPSLPNPLLKDSISSSG